ncbi:MAG: hypothetical protein KatS3mg129_0090 [Leptospiraceae bacterium]|nr:MAG: hypothetical protein KatS3mg129_0090 [Leptospiraceae bacterium]
MPEIRIADPVLFFDSIDFNYDIYIDNKLYHQYGKFDQNGNVIFTGWPVHIIPLKKEFSGKTLYLKAYSIKEYPDIGIWKKQMIINRAELYQYLLKDFFSFSIISLIFYFTSLLSFAFYITNLKLIHNLYFSLIAFFIGNYIFFSPKNLFLNILYSNPLLYFALENFSQYFLVVFFAIYLMAIFEIKHQWSKYTLILIHYLFIILILIGFIIFIFYRNTFFIFHYYINIITVFVLLIFIVILLSRIVRYDINAIYMLIGFLSVFISGFFELSVYFRIFEFINTFHIGCLIFLFCNFIILSNKYWNTYYLLEKTNELLKEKQKQLENVQELKDKFMIELSYKIINPLEDIISFIRDISIKSTEKEILYKILENLKKEVSRIKNLLSYERNQFSFKAKQIDLIEFLKNLNLLILKNVQNKNINIFIDEKLKNTFITFDSDLLLEVIDELLFYSSHNVNIYLELKNNKELLLRFESENVYMYPQIDNYFYPYLKLNFLETTGLYLVYVYMKYFNSKFEYYITNEKIIFLLKFSLNPQNELEGLKNKERYKLLMTYNKKKIITLKNNYEKDKPKILFINEDPIILKQIYNILKDDYYIFCTNDLSIAELQLQLGYDILIFPPLIYGNPTFSFFRKIRNQYDPFSLIAILINPYGFFNQEENKNLGIQDIIFIENERINKEELKLRIQNNLLLKEYYKKYLDYLKYYNDVLTLGELQNYFYKDYDYYKKYFDYDIKYLPADQISGDLLEIYKISEKEILILIADVTGHGLYSAFFSVFLRISIELLIQENPDTTGNELLKKINKMIIKYFNKQLVTLSMVFLNIENKIIKFYRAGHLPALYYDSRKNIYYELYPKGRILGVLEDDDWEELIIQYNIGDRIFLYTDGFIETAFKDRSQKILNLIKEYSNISIKELSDKVFYEVLQYKSSKNQEDKFIEDDITTIFIELK